MVPQHYFSGLHKVSMKDLKTFNQNIRETASTILHALQTCDWRSVLGAIVEVVAGCWCIARKEEECDITYYLIRYS